ncbi:5-demethoxyubiquinol-8 5-hydroxylase UbiM [Lautropia mirabilis]|jgi:ubiquinone biosynthesis hydroxylase, ubiH/ubiF/visC/COQ6 family|uniref:5-demethoxyubiquinol-8 5-hydroxylase UbiM n=1 Tax=Lautropia mirabilis TaxID=47671 RepID=UPI0028CFDC51|nr:5-demethoxyubiquinol-8 5-hydroxylase UbiM [Lautropia mirabilis]
MEFDLLISGAGPAGLCLARALADTGLTIGLVEQQPEEALREAAFDGREIALTQRSASLMRELGLWKRIQDVDGAAFSPLRDARVFNGSSPFAMLIGHTLTNRSELGWLVSNHHIRRAAYAEVKAAAEEHGRITLMTGQPITRVLAQGEGEMTEVLLADGTTHRARLLVAADSRFSPTRRAMGVGASMHDFGRTMLVCQMTHEVPHNHVAWEWFDYGQTLALLPMNDDPVTGEHRASTVLTLPHQRIEPLLTMDEAAFGEEMSRRYHGRLGRMQLTSTRHSYPLVGVMPHRLVSRRFACVGDAAVGMHPVTAHGFNFGLLSIDTLAEELRTAHASGKDIGSPDLLARYERRHMLATRPLYEVTKLIATLYTTEAAPAKLLRNAALHLGQRFTPFRKLVAASLTGSL